MCNEEPRELQENRDMLSNFVMIARVTGVRSALPRYIVELVAIICTSLKSVFWVDSAAEIRIVRWKVTSVQRKGSFVQWKASRSAVESWSSQITSQLPNRLLSMTRGIFSFLSITFLVCINYNLTNLIGVIRKKQ